MSTECHIESREWNESRVRGGPMVGITEGSTMNARFWYYANAWVKITLAKMRAYIVLSGQTTATSEIRAAKAVAR